MISIDIGNTYISIVELDGSANKINIIKKERVTNIKPVIGIDGKLDIPLLSGFLQPIVNEMKSTSVLMTFSALTTVSNSYVLPFDKNKRKMLEMVKSKVFQNLSPEEYIMDYKINKVFDEDGINKCNVVTYVVSRNIVLDSRKCIIKLGKKPAGFSCAQNNIFNFANTFIQNQSLIMIYVSDIETYVHLLNFPEDIITRTLAFTENDQNNILASIIGDSNTRDSELADLVSKSIKYHKIKYSGKPLEAVYLIGDGADSNTAEYLTQNIGLPVNLIEDAKSNIKFDMSDIKNFIYSIGAAVDFKDINLYEVLKLENKPRLKPGKKIFIMSFSSIILINVALILVLLYFNDKELDTQKELNDKLSLPIVSEVFKNDIILKKNLIKIQNQLLFLELLDNQIKENQSFNTDIYDSVIDVMPSEVFIKSITYNNNELSISCTTKSGNPPADFVKLLDSTGKFAKINYKGFAKENSENSDVEVIFSIVCTLNIEKEELLP